MTKEPGQVRNTLSTLLTVKKFHAEGKYCDVVLRVGRKLFKCQRSLLAANSEYFDIMFSGTFKESKTPSDEPITLHELNAKAFEEILHFIYTGVIRINDSNIYQLLLMSDFLRLRSAHVKEEFFKYLENRCEKSKPVPDALALFTFAHMKTENKLVRILTAHVCKRLYHYSKDQKLMVIPFEYLNALLKSSKNYIILSLPGSQNVVLKIVHNWINYDRNERGKHRCELMKNINFSYISRDFMSLLMSNLDNFADKVTGLPKDRQSLGKLKKLKVEMVHNINVHSAQTEGTLSLSLKPSKLRMNEEVFSAPRTISNLSWKLSAKRSYDNDFGVYLHCNGNFSVQRWKCYVRVVFTLMSHKKDKENLVDSFCHIFSSNMEPCDFGFVNLIKWTDIIDPKNGYVNDDGLITLKAVVFADVPFSSRMHNNVYF